MFIGFVNLLQAVDPDYVTGIVAAIFLGGPALSWLLEFFPGLRAIWNGITTKWKPVAFLIGCLVVTYGLAGLACANVIFGGAACPADGAAWAELLLVAIAAFTGGIANFHLAVKPTAERMKNA